MSEAFTEATRRVRVLVFHRDRPGRWVGDTLTLMDEEINVDSIDSKTHFTAWNAWLGECAGKWLASREPLAPGAYVALLVDPATRDLNGFEGYRCLSQEIELTYVAP